MLRLALVFLIVAIIAGAMGLFRVEYVASEIAWALFLIFLVLAVVSVVFGRRLGPPLD